MMMMKLWSFFPSLLYFIHFRDVPVCVCGLLKERARISYHKIYKKGRAPVSAAMITTQGEHTPAMLLRSVRSRKKRDRGHHARTTKPSTPPIFSSSSFSVYLFEPNILLTSSLIRFSSPQKFQRENSNRHFFKFCQI